MLQGCGNLGGDKTIAYLALMPIVDFLSDCAMFSVTLNEGDLEWALLIGGVIVLFFRFQMLYAALTPTPALGTVNMLYCPCLLLHDGRYHHQYPDHLPLLLHLPGVQGAAVGPQGVSDKAQAVEILFGT